MNPYNLLYGFVAALLLASPAKALIGVMEGLPTTKDGVYIGTTTPQLLLNGGTFYAGTVPNVSLAASSNVVVGNCVFYATGTVHCAKLEGDGSGITGINSAVLTSTQTFSGYNTFLGSSTFTGHVLNIGSATITTDDNISTLGTSFPSCNVSGSTAGITSTTGFVDVTLTGIIQNTGGGQSVYVWILVNGDFTNLASSSKPNGGVFAVGTGGYPSTIIVKRVPVSVGSTVKSCYGISTSVGNGGGFEGSKVTTYLEIRDAFN